MGLFLPLIVKMFLVFIIFIAILVPLFRPTQEKFVTGKANDWGGLPPEAKQEKILEDCKRNEEKKVELEKKVEDLNNKVEAVKTSQRAECNDRVKSEMKDADTKIDSLNSQVKTVSDISSACQKKNEEVQRDYADIKQKYDMVSPDLMKAQACCESKTKELQQCNEKYDSLKHDYNTMKPQYEAQIKKLEHSEAMILKLNGIIKTLEKS